MLWIEEKTTHGLWESPRFTDFPSNLIGRECETNTLRMLRKSSPASALDPNHRPEGLWALGTRIMLKTNQSKITRSQSRCSRQCVAQCLFQLAL